MRSTKVKKKWSAICRDIFAFLLLTFNLGHAAGTVAGEEFLIGMGARPASLGESYSAVATGALCPYWNVGGLGFLTYQDVYLTHTNWFQDITLDSGSYALPLFSGVGLGFFYTQLGSPPLQETGEAAPSDPNYPLPSQYSSPIDPTTGQPIKVTVPLGAFVGGGAVGFSLSEHEKVGVGFKFLSESFGDTGFKGFAVDAGLMVKPLFEATALGISLQNVGPAIQGYSLPSLVRAGFALKTNYDELARSLGAPPANVSKNHDMLLTTDTSYELIGKDFGYHLGAEYSPTLGQMEFSVRGGILRQKSLATVWTAGLGLAMTFGGMEFHLDYAYVPYDLLGDSNRISVEIAF